MPRGRGRARLPESGVARLEEFAAHVAELTSAGTDADRGEFRWRAGTHEKSTAEIISFDR